MKHLLKLYAYIIGFFVGIFLLMNLTGWLSVSDVKHYVAAVTGSSPLVIGLVIGLLLASDVFFAVPTIFLVTSAGYLLGFWAGLLVTVAGMFFSGLIAYTLCRWSGHRILRWVLGGEDEMRQVRELFHTYGSGALIVSRALPMLPESTCCLAGIHRMPFGKFALFYLLGTLPYAVVLVYLGSVSSRENPYPALLGISGVYVILWAIWWKMIRKNNKPS